MFDFPNNPTNNQQVTGPGGQLYQFDLVKWVPVGPLSPTGAIYVGDTPPNAPDGSLWWDSNATTLRIKYNDGNSTAWVDASPTGLPDAPSVAGTAYGRSSGSWTAVPTMAQMGGNTGRNLIHNPLFNVAQRGTGGFTATGGGPYTLDRWQTYVGLDTATISQQTFAMGQLAGEEGASYCLTNVFAGTSGATAFTLVQQPIEDVRRLSNRTVTASFWAAAASGTPKLGVSIDQNFGTGGSPSAQVSGTGQAVTISTAWTRYTLTFTVPTVSGKTLGTNGDSKTQLVFWYSSGTNNATRAGSVGVQSATISIWGVQLEIGSVATPLAKRDPADDLALCQRFYQTGTFQLAGYAATGIGSYISVLLPVQMRATPAIGTNSTTATNVTSPALNALNNYGLSPFATATATGGFVWSGNFTASADL